MLLLLQLSRFAVPLLVVAPVLLRSTARPKSLRTPASQSISTLAGLQSHFKKLRDPCHWVACAVAKEYSPVHVRSGSRSSSTLHHERSPWPASSGGYRKLVMLAFHGPLAAC
jgi:hypothetical protein